MAISGLGMPRMVIRHMALKKQIPLAQKIFARAISSQEFPSLRDVRLTWEESEIAYKREEEAALRALLEKEAYPSEIVVIESNKIASKAPETER